MADSRYDRDVLIKFLPPRPVFGSRLFWRGGCPVRFRVCNSATVFVLAFLLVTRVFSQTVDLFDSGINGFAFTSAVQTDGRIVVGGQFTGLGGQSVTNIGRLNADGSLDSTFNAGATFF